MDVMNSPNNTTLESLIDKLRTDFPEVVFVEAAECRWSPEEQTIYYKTSDAHPEWSVLHELGHVQSNHLSYSSDIELLMMEAEAWQEAKQLATSYDIKVNAKHIEKCLDSYRDWLYRRSACPNCTQCGIEQSPGRYRCINCGQLWQVSPERFCRVYRKTA